MREDIAQPDHRSGFGVQSRANFCASAICVRVIFTATASRSSAMSARIVHYAKAELRNCVAFLGRFFDQSRRQLGAPIVAAAAHRVNCNTTGLWPLSE
jgi:hypothetical protein